MIRDRVRELRRVRAGDLVPHERNWRTHPARQRAALSGILEEVGYAEPLVVYQRKDGKLGLIDGHLRAGLDPDQKVPVVVLDVTEAEAAKLLASLDPIGELAGKDKKKLAELLETFEADTDAVRSLLKSLGARKQHKTNPDAIPSAKKAVTKRGDLWILGDHRLLCDDSTSEAAVHRLLDGQKADALIIDPPYCSGGFQEAGRAQGSKGTTSGDREIRNDTLSSRGYRALVSQAILNAGATAVYVFTDWRMWVWTFDLAEASGYGVRAMIVWDKASPGMGLGWRHQHELILFGARTNPWPKDAKNWTAYGDVISVARQANELHTTQKPVEVLGRILEVSKWAKNVVDTFAGSGSTLIACEEHGRRFFGMELEPGYCDVAVRRWEQFTGKKAERLARSKK